MRSGFGVLLLWFEEEILYQSFWLLCESGVRFSFGWMLYFCLQFGEIVGVIFHLLWLTFLGCVDSIDDFLFFISDVRYKDYSCRQCLGCMINRFFNFCDFKENSERAPMFWRFEENLGMHSHPGLICFWESTRFLWFD